MNVRVASQVEEILETLVFDGEYPDKRQISIFVQENCEKSALRHSIEKPILLNFVNLSTIPCPRL